MENLTDNQIIESVLEGNLADYNLLMDRYKHKAWSLLLRMVKNEMDAEELLQDSFIKAYNGLKNFRRDAKFSTWFYRIVYNSALSHLESKSVKKDKQTGTIEENVAGSIQPDSDVHKEERLRVIKKALRALPENYALVINLFYIQEQTIAEICEITGNTVANVKVQLHRARTAMKKYLEENRLVEEL